MREQSRWSPVFLLYIGGHYAVSSPQNRRLCVFQTSKEKRDADVEHETCPNGTSAVIMHLLTWSDSKP